MATRVEQSSKETATLPHPSKPVHLRYRQGEEIHARTTEELNPKGTRPAKTEASPSSPTYRQEIRGPVPKVRTGIGQGEVQ